MSNLSSCPRFSFVIVLSVINKENDFKSPHNIETTQCHGPRYLFLDMSRWTKCLPRGLLSSRIGPSLRSAKCVSFQASESGHFVVLHVFKRWRMEWLHRLMLACWIPLDSDFVALLSVAAFVRLAFVAHFFPLWKRNALLELLFVGSAKCY